MTKMTTKDIAKLPKYSKARCGGVYRISDTIYVDNIEGLGATKAHREIATRGFMNRFSIDTFLGMCPPVRADDSDVVTRRQARIAEICEIIQGGRGVACPRIFLNVDSFIEFGKGRCTVVDAEGAEVAEALRQLGITELNIQIVLLGYSMTNIDNLSEFYDHISNGIIANGQLFKNLISPAKS